MIPVWIFAIFVVLFAVVVIWDRFEIKKMSDNQETLEFFLDIYVSKYGTLDGMRISEEGSDANKK